MMSLQSIEINSKLTMKNNMNIKAIIIIIKKTKLIILRMTIKKMFIARKSGIGGESMMMRWLIMIKSMGRKKDLMIGMNNN